MTIYSKLVKNNNAPTPVLREGRYNPYAVYFSQEKLGKRILLYIRNSQISTATTATIARLLAWLIKTLGRRNSNAYLYIHCPSAVLATVPCILANADLTYQPPWEPDL